MKTITTTASVVAAIVLLATVAPARGHGFAALTEGEVLEYLNESSGELPVGACGLEVAAYLEDLTDGEPPSVFAAHFDPVSYRIRIGNALGDEEIVTTESFEFFLEAWPSGAHPPGSCAGELWLYLGLEPTTTVLDYIAVLLNGTFEFWYIDDVVFADGFEGGDTSAWSVARE